MLTEMLDGCVRGDGCVVTVGGHAGVGKSRLARELHARSDDVHGASMRWLWGSAEAHAPRGLQALRRALTAYMWARSVDVDQLTRCELVAALRVAMIEDTDLANAEIGDTSESLATFLTGRNSDPQSCVDHGDARDAADPVHAFHAFFQGLACRRPVTLVVDDYHWADTPTARLAWLLADVAADAPLYLVALYRPPIVGECGSLLAAGARLDSRYASIHLEDLNTAAAVQLARGLAGGETITDELASAVLYRCGGNPLFIEETLRPLHDGEVTADRLLDSPVPKTVHEAVRRRMDTMPAASVRVLELAAVIGPRFSLEALRTISDDPTTLARAIEDLRRRELIVPQVSRPKPVRLPPRAAARGSLRVDRRWAPSASPSGPRPIAGGAATARGRRGSR
jgi:predicted ATPase